MNKGKEKGEKIKKVDTISCFDYLQSISDKDRKKILNGVGELNLILEEKFMDLNSIRLLGFKEKNMRRDETSEVSLGRLKIFLASDS